MQVRAPFHSMEVEVTQVRKPIYLWTKLTDAEWASFLRGETVMMDVAEGTENEPPAQRDPVIGALTAIITRRV